MVLEAHFSRLQVSIHTPPARSSGADVGGSGARVCLGGAIHVSITNVAAVVVCTVVKKCCGMVAALPNGCSIEQPLGSKQAVDGQITELTSDFFQHTHSFSNASHIFAENTLTLQRNGKMFSLNLCTRLLYGVYRRIH